MTSVLSVVLSTQTVFAHDVPVIAPTQLDFDASQAPKECNNEETYRNLLGNWVPRNAKVVGADRHLIVRIRRSPRGEKLADVTLVDATGATLKEHHARYSVKDECYKVLYDTAYAAANLLGAFDKPPPPEPIVCPACPPASAPAKLEPGPVSAPMLPRRRMAVPVSLIPRVTFGAGVFLGMTTTNEVSVGPTISLGFVPFSCSPGFHIEYDGAWTSQKTQQGIRVDTVPLFASVCHAHDGLRLCGGLTTTFLSTEQRKETRDFMLSASLRIGTEFVIAGPFSIRADAFALLPLTQRTALDTPNPVTAGAIAMGVWSLE